MTKEQPKPSYGTFREKLTLDDVDGKNAVLTIATAELKNFAPTTPNGEWKIVLTFLQFPEEGGEHEREYIMNSTSYKTVVSKFGTEDYEEWVGKEIVLGPVDSEFNGKKFRKINVPLPDVWEKCMAAHKKAKR